MYTCELSVAPKQYVGQTLFRGEKLSVFLVDGEVYVSGRQLAVLTCVSRPVIRYHINIASDMYEELGLRVCVGEKCSVPDWMVIRKYAVNYLNAKGKRGGGKHLTNFYHWKMVSDILGGIRNKRLSSEALNWLGEVVLEVKCSDQKKETNSELTITVGENV